MISLSSFGSLEKVFFTKHLSMFLKSGIPLSEALNSLGEENGKSSVRRILRAVRADVENGKPLYEALARHPKSFDTFFVSMVQIGELSGTLEKSLDFLSEKINRETILRKKIQTLLYYPSVVLAAAVIIGGFLSFFVLPKLGDMFKSFDVALPMPTRILIFFAQSAKDYGILVVLFLIVFIFALSFLIAVLPRLKYLWHKLKLIVPVTGRIVLSASLSAFFRNLSVMLSSGLPLEKALRTEAEISENLVIRGYASDFARAVSRGKHIGDYLKSQKQTLFPSLCSRMILVGEMSGKLEESFKYLAEFFEEDTEAQARNAAAILEPALLLIIGVVVAFVALAVILPIYSLTGSIHG